MSCRPPLLLPSLLLPLLAASVSYKEMIRSDDSTNILSWHKLRDCPSDSDNFFHDQLRNGHCERQPANREGIVTYQCGTFQQYCFNKTMKITCDSYLRSCDRKNVCEEKYENCVTEITDYTALVTKATGEPAQVYAECIPAVEALRDQCNSTFSCYSQFTFDPVSDELTSCRIDCSSINMTCYNYTRTCSEEISEVINTRKDQTIKIETSECEVITLERRLDEHMIWDSTVIEVDDNGVEKAKGSVIVNRTVNYGWSQDVSWENCTENTQVGYEPMCNQFIRHMMEPLKDVVYEPHAYDLTEGIKTFLSLWDDGYNILCNVKFNCFVQLIKFSRSCWPGLPLQRFVPGADYASLETLLKNMTRVACAITPPPQVKFKGNDSYLNAKNSCISFFDVESPITKPHYDNFTMFCAGDADNECSPACNETLNGYAARFGCCLGSIVFEYNVHRDWYRLFNFANNDVIVKLEQCGTGIETRCELQDPSSIVVVVVRNFLYIIGGVMTLVVITMTVSFYWQLEHEPIKKAFYHF